MTIRTCGSANLELEAINRELAELMHQSSLELAFGSEAALSDELVLCGILGGKDVGKSTLINALAEQTVSSDLLEVGRGTDRPMAYVHENAQSRVAGRLSVLESPSDLNVTVHRADALKNMVLIDLPDFDSDFLDHLEVVRRVLPRLDRVLWVMTPRKIGDRAWVELAADVFKDAENVCFVLNKFDELLADSAPWIRDPAAGIHPANGIAERFWQSQHHWVAKTLQAIGYDHCDDHRFLVAAAFASPDRFTARVGELWDDPHWTRHGTDRSEVAKIAGLAAAELVRLRAAVLTPVSGDQAHRLKTANYRRELDATAAQIAAHYKLDENLARLSGTDDATQSESWLASALGPEFCTNASISLSARLRSDSQLADELLQERVEHWPLLPIVYWPFGWLSRVLGRHWGPTTREAFPTTAADPFLIEEMDLERRVDQLRSQVLADQARVIRQFRLEGEIPTATWLSQRLRSASGELVARAEIYLLNEARKLDRRPGLVGKASLWLIVLWFPLLQPVGEAYLQASTETSPVTLTLALARLVWALGATHLLTSLAIVAIIFIALLAGMYSRRLRILRRIRSGEREGLCSLRSYLTDEVERLVEGVVGEPLIAPLRRTLNRLRHLRERLASCHSAERE